MTHLENELDRLRRQNAAMRYALDTILAHPNALALPGRPDLASLRGLAYRAISNTADSDYISKESVKPLVEALLGWCPPECSIGIKNRKVCSCANCHESCLREDALAHAKSLGLPTEKEGA